MIDKKQHFFFILSSMTYFPIAFNHQSVFKDSVIFVEFCSESKSKLGDILVIYHKTRKVFNLATMLNWAAKK